MTNAALFQEFSLGNLQLKNRTILAPMTRVSATEDGIVSDLMHPYYEAFAKGGFAALITEGVYTDQHFSQGYAFQPGITNVEQQNAWEALVERVQDAGSRIIIQLMHAGALSQSNRFSAITKGPSAVQPKGAQLEFYRGQGKYPVPQEMSAADIEDAIKGFVTSAKRAQETGANGVEIHGANGYLLDQFLTDHTNTRKDKYGGGTRDRLQLTIETIERVRAATGKDLVVGVRISQGKVNDFEHKWAGEAEDARITFDALGRSGATYVHTTEFQANMPAFPGSPSLAKLAREHSGLPVIANGGLDDPQVAEEVLTDGHADLIALGKAALATPDWPNRVKKGNALETFSFDMFSPLADLESANAYHAAKG